MKNQEGSTSRMDMHERHSEINKKSEPKERMHTKSMIKALKSRCRIKKVQSTARRGTKGIEEPMQSQEGSTNSEKMRKEHKNGIEKPLKDKMHNKKQMAAKMRGWIKKIRPQREFRRLDQQRGGGA